MSFRAGGQDGGRPGRQHSRDLDGEEGSEPNDSLDGTPMDENGGDDEKDVEVEDDGMAAMQAMMGFGDFGSTKGQKVAGNVAGAVRKTKKTEYRQYMNRVGGFNRPLSPTR